MFDIGASEFLLIVVVAVVVIGPKDLPAALRTAGRWIAQVRRVSGHFRSGLAALIDEAEREEANRDRPDHSAETAAPHPAAPVHNGTLSAAPPSHALTATDSIRADRARVQGAELS